MRPVTRFVEGAVWMVGMRWAIRSAGLVSTVILARILTPADFGIVAMAALVHGLLRVCADLGTAQLLLRMGSTDRGAYDTAWTIGWIQTIVLAVALFFLAYPASIYFKEPRLLAVMQVVAVGSLVNGFGNIGIVMLRRDLDFRRDFVFGLVGKIINVVPTVILAVVFRSYWALVAGHIIGGALEVLLSYRMHPFRPRLSLSHWRRFASYSLWMTPSNIANYFNQKADVFIVGFMANTAQMGAYNVAAELSRMATAEIATPMARAIYPNYAKLKDNLEELSAAFLLVFRSICIVSFSFGFGIAAVAEDAVYVVLGDQWGFAVPLMFWLGIFGAFSAILSSATGHVLLVLGRERTLFFANWIKLTVFGSSVLIAAHLGDVTDIAMAAALSTGGFAVVSLLYLPRILPVRAFAPLLEMGRMLGAGLAMLVAVKMLHSNAIQSHFVTLLIDVGTGAVVFLAILWVLWISAGRPDGPERRLLAFVSKCLRNPALRG